MARSFGSRAALFTLFLIPGLYALGIGTELTLLEQNLSLYAGLLSIIMATFVFIQSKTLDRAPSVKRTLLIVLLLLGGIIILVPGIYDYLYGINALLDGILIAGYVLLLLFTAFFTRNEKVSGRDIRQAESLERGEYADDPLLTKIMKRRK